VRALRAYYLGKERYEAYRNLMNAIRVAAERIEANPTGGVSHPTPYPGMSCWGFRWIKVHRYWLAWSMDRGYPVVTNVLFDTSNMAANVAPDEGEAGPF
jgi:hypothetical protein